jgi:hypothetical protein
MDTPPPSAFRLMVSAIFPDIINAVVSFAPVTP